MKNNNTHLYTNTSEKEFRSVFMGLTLVVSLLILLSVVGLSQRILPEESLTGAGVSTEDSSVKCTLRGTARLPAFSMDGDFVIGGVFSMHYKLHTVIYNYTTKPEALKCTGR